MPGLVAEMITKKSKIYKFDDLHCYYSFINPVQCCKRQILPVYILWILLNTCGLMFKTKHAYFYKSRILPISPMNGNIAAFSQADSLAKYCSNIFNGNKYKLGRICRNEDLIAYTYVCYWISIVLGDCKYHPGITRQLQTISLLR